VSIEDDGEGYIRYGRGPGSDELDRLRMCEGKKRYATEAEAKGHVQHLRSRRLGRGGLRFYACRFCQGWHVGSPHHGA
jgi:hypothetical protein